MDKVYSHTEVEKKWYDFWEKEGLFKADIGSKKKPFSLLMPPPNLTGELHLGHAMQHSILDGIARFKRMQGYDVLLLPGVDHASIAFENTLNKILTKESLSKQKLGKEKWLERAWKYKDDIYKSFHQNWTVFGISADWEREVFTFDEERQKAVFEEFKNFWDQGLIYKGAYIVQWCPKCGTAIEDVEMEYQERKEKLYYVNYLVLTDNEFIAVATARPETIFADVAIAVYPNHPKYKKFVGKSATNPLLIDLKPMIKIIEDKRVDKDFGTGALKITPGHDPLDFEIGKDNDLPVLHAIDKTGRMTHLAQDLEGLKIEEAREKSVEILNKVGAIEKVEEYIHSVPVCERCKTVVEPLISEEWFVKMDSMAKVAIQEIKMGEINFFPRNYSKILIDWLENIHDWCISRNLWWGHKIPVWYKDEEMKVSISSPGADWKPDERILDTWFSSGLWPLLTLGWPKETDFSKKYFPWNFCLSAPEIKYLWIARMIMLSLHFKKEIPFKDMFFHGMLRDPKGQKFSKSLGNGIDPAQLREVWGADATRMALYSYSIPGRDGFLSRRLIDERCKSFRNFSTKLQNISRFIIDLKPKEAKNEKENKDDKWILGELEKTRKIVTKNMDNYEMHLATAEIYDFIWHKFADVYIEKSKSRREESQTTLEKVFGTSLLLLHPFMPFITEELWHRLGNEDSIMIQKWPPLSKNA